MDSSPQSSASSSQAKGFATIALASAAGVIVASRMNRPALMLAAGLALSWWQKRASAAARIPATEKPIVDEADMPSNLTEDSDAVNASVMPVTHSPTLPAFPEAPRRPVEPLVNAWDDLRAAISPEVRKVVSVTEPVPPMPAFVEHSEAEEESAPPMPNFIISAPSSPLIAADDLDEVMTEPDMHFIPRSAGLSRSIPDSISLPIIAEIESTLEAGSGDFMLTETSTNQAPTTPMGHPDSFMVPDAHAEIAPSTAPSPNSPVKLLADPDMGSRESQSKKTFFDWLRS